MTAADHATPISREPAQRLDRRAVSIWRIDNLVLAIVVVVVSLVSALILIHGTDRIADWPVIAGAILLTVACFVVLWYVPELDWRHWRFEIRDDEIDLKHGWFTTTRTLVPMSRVQHLDTQRSPVERRYRAATVVIHTAGGTVSIPALPEDQAAAIVTRIAALSNIHDDL